jgi:hypothetical protein
LRKALLGLLGVGMLVTAGAGPAFAAVAGTSEGTDPVTGAGTNQVDCGGPSNNLVPGAPVTIAGEQTGTGGALVVCNDSASLPIQGRVILTGDTSGGYIAADGDADNTQDPKAAGFVRADIGANPGVRCGDPAGNLNAENPGPTDDSSQCG